MSKVIATRKADDGDLIGFKLDDGRELDFVECMEAIHNGEVQGLICAPGRSGRIVIRSMPDGDPTNNLANLPNF